MIYVDTSAFLAIIDASDAHHARIQKCWLELLETDEKLGTNKYVVVERAAINQNRVGLKAVRTMMDELLPVIEVDWLDPEQHELARYESRSHSQPPKSQPRGLLIL